MSNQSNSGMNFGGVLFLIFLVLKLVKVINWSWWWVTSPLWLPFALFMAVWILALIINKGQVTITRRKRK